MAVPQGDAAKPCPPRRAPFGNSERAPAYRRAALRVCGRSGGGVCARQHRPLSCLRLAAAAARGVVRPARRFSRRADRERRRSLPAGAVPRAVPHHSDGYGGGSFLAGGGWLGCWVVLLLVGGCVGGGAL